MDNVTINDMELYELYYVLCVYLLHDEDIVSYDIDLIWKKMNEYYYMEKGFYLDIDKEESLHILFNFIREKVRYELLDELMLHVYNRFINKEELVDNRDKFFINNILEMKKIMNYEQEYITNNMCNKDYEIPKISTDEVIFHVKNILGEIDPSMEWLGIYNDAIANGRIIYLNILNDVEKDVMKKKLGIKTFDGISNSCFFPNSNECYIMLTYKGDISDIPTTVHEVIHYISRLKNNSKNEKPVLREMPSIFFEFYALNYLKRMGYDSDILKIINDARFADTKESLEDVSNMTDYLIKLIKNGRITSDGRDKACDNCTYDLVTNPYVYFKSYPYVIGNYLAIMGMDKLRYDDMVLSKMKYVTERVSTIDPYDVFKIVGYDNMNNLTRTKSKKRTRKK